MIRALTIIAVTLVLSAAFVTCAILALAYKAETFRRRRRRDEHQGA